MISLFRCRQAVLPDMLTSAGLPLFAQSAEQSVKFKAVNRVTTVSIRDSWRRIASHRGKRIVSVQIPGYFSLPDRVGDRRRARALLRIRASRVACGAGTAWL
jgi:hypothetical protein